MSQILEFYRGTIKHPNGLTFEETLDLPNVVWERCHNYIQWLFPLPEASKLHPNAPVADRADFEAFRTDSVLQAKLRAAVARYLRFLQEYRGWVRAGDHNHLRVTRVIRCLILAWMPEDAEAFLNSVMLVCENKVSDQTLYYWQEALNLVPEWLESPEES